MLRSATPAWRQGRAYLRRGLAGVRRAPGLYAQLALVYAAPALLAAYLAITVPEPGPVERIALAVLPWITASFAPVVVMLAVSFLSHGRPAGLGRVSWRALFWLPRYLWTNAHTSVIFWAPMLLLLAARGWLEAAVPAAGPPGAALVALGWLLVGLAALGLHTRTLLAPFLAVHGDLPATLATLEGWRLSGRHFGVCLATLLWGSLPVALPVGLLGVALWAALPPPAWSGLLAALPQLVWVAIHLMRPILIPAVYALYQDLWHAEQARRARVGAPAIPAVARGLLALTRPLPKLGRPLPGQ